MYLHLGSDVVVSQSEILAIFDMDTTSFSYITKEFLAHAQREYKIIDVSRNDLPKSYILCGTKQHYYIYISPLSASTLYKRAVGRFKVSDLL